MDQITAMRADLERHKRLREDADRAIAEIETALKVLARYTSSDGVTAANSQGIPLASTPPAEVADKAAVLLSDGPLWRSLPQLCNELLASDVKIGGADPVGNLSTILSRNKVRLGFVADKRRGWALAARASADAWDDSHKE
jgi:hypothetical protein